jgi:glycerol 3-phosphatase-1
VSIPPSSSQRLTDADRLTFYGSTSQSWRIGNVCVISFTSRPEVLIEAADIGEAEGRIPKEYGADAVELPGSRKLLDQLEQNAIPWCIVTSGTRPLVTGWLDIMKLAHPKNMVTAEDVENGKPDPACYELGKTKLGLPQQQPSIVVFEDAPAGVRSGKAAGFVVVALHTTHTLDQLREAGADFIVRDMRSVVLKEWDRSTGEATIEVLDALV